MNTIPIAYENADILIINKPAGLATQGGKGILSSVDTILPKQLGYKVYLVHRLDRDTAGLLVVAKTSAAAAEWTKLISSKQVQKEYYALCLGDFPSAAGTITEDVMHKGSAKSAITHFSLEKTGEVLLGDTEDSVATTVRLSLVRLVLGTGRMHQLRIHLASQGTPIAGDDKYGDFKLNKLVKKYCGIKKLQLAAVQLSLPLKDIPCMSPCNLQKSQIVGSEKEKIIAIKIELPEHMQKTLAVLV